jgi:hypothetical protein
MSDKHSEIKDNVCGIMGWYGFNCDQEYPVTNGYIDCVAYRNSSSEPFMGIEVHIQGNLDTDLKKLLSASFLTNRVIVTPDRNLIDKMSKSMPNIFWCTPPSENDHSFENHVRNLAGALVRNKYWYDGLKVIRMIELNNEAIIKFENLLKENGLDPYFAEYIIYNFASAGGGLPQKPERFMITNEYKFLKSLGIIQGAGIYWFDMEWGDGARYTYESAEVPNVTSTRKMKGEPIAYLSNKIIIDGVMKKYVENIKETLGGRIVGYSDIFSEAALIGTKGFYRPYKRNFIPASEYLKWTPTIEINRLQMLVANPFLSSRVWEFGKDLVRSNLGLELATDLITAPYELIVKTFGFTGSAMEREEEINEYLAWWILYVGGERGENMSKLCKALDVPFETLLKCIDETFSIKLTSRYIEETELSSMTDLLSSYGGHKIEGVGGISVFKPKEFESYCSKKMKESLNNIF